jgi:putative tryptophan/tyrosine transport system substrate-binding protein
MNRRATVLALLALGATPLGSFAQQPSKVWRIGMLETISMSLNAANLDAFLKGMQNLGYVEGRNFVIDYRSADGSDERFPDLAAELLRGKVDLIPWSRRRLATRFCSSPASRDPVAISQD